MNIHDTVQQLIDRARSVNLIGLEDEKYARNQILMQLGLESFSPEGTEQGTDSTIPDLLEDIVEYAVKHEIIEEILDEKEKFSASIMDTFIARPSDINTTFYQNYKEDPKQATDYFYTLSKTSNYIQTKRIKKNISYKVETEYGDLDITINLSKPEKDPKQIAKEREMKVPQTSYPKCLLCVENEGYAGRIGHPARSNHRLIRLNLDGESWMFQYSPYVYYNEHSIILSEQHRDMKIDYGAFKRLLEFTEKFPHYFVGSNADLPIVGGSILSHDHYQGGRYEFAMSRAENDFEFSLNQFPSTKASFVKWPMSVIRIRSVDRKELAEAADHILAKWRKYSDPEVGILAKSADTPHNTITPIVRRRGDDYELDLVLRNNRTSEEHPMGIFHPHSDVHHIKKENIGLIEVMGLAVLPARLKSELKEVGNYILGRPNDIKDYHHSWAEELKSVYANTSNEGNVEIIVREEVGKKFKRVLEDAGVFKRNETGMAAFKRFIDTL